MKKFSQHPKGYVQLADLHFAAKPAVWFVITVCTIRAVNIGDGTELTSTTNNLLPTGIISGSLDVWPPRPETFNELLTPIEAAQYLRLDETGAHDPKAAIRTLNYWRDRGDLKATKFARRVWFRKAELNQFLERKTES